MFTPEGNCRTFDKDRIVVSKTNVKGRITYANKEFLELAEFTEDEVIGQPHSMIRSSAMPRCVFKLLWDRLEQKREVFAYVVNKSKFNDHYWVFAHVTPSMNAAGEVTSYHSNRRVASPEAQAQISELYGKLLEIERSSDSRKVGLENSTAALHEMLNEKGMDYDEFIFTL
ncbi:PAS domain-containing protein [Maritalea sp.]|uniref:PAS domain-containing protein n=1 Tax=Maritalea sp. TaxID=2003361 RepID=UPI003EF85257